MSVAAVAHWLVIVQRDRQDLYERLRKSVGRNPLVQVILDRRRAERRRGSAPAASERRRGERRRSAVPKDRSSTNGYRLIEQADGFVVFQATARVPAECPQCGVAIDFEMPRFAELPAWVDNEVIHTADMKRVVQHYIETQAFRASGRPFLACRMLAQPCLLGPKPGSPQPATARP